MPKQGVTVAAPRNVKFGTRVRIEGVGERIALDRTSKRFDGRWDVYFSRHEDALRFGKRELKVTVNK